ncbi:PIN domain-containing protein [Synechococcales cyanobacterium C]|uniref:PIN domain-containing protein n=1 Tax=Petrachloros mirabilis ULC683 TaxID=2781853 RepID=A0A8K1ZYD7_9CYAN|nr:PIN domain-containing protein [Petrachloros mirabilis]NCJ06281.1 PIN domain-containing protein [Petrachloros mirabilis ULC683]
MAKQYKIYLDVCCLNRPFDDQTQERIRLEAEAVLLILRKCQTKSWKLVISSALDAEIRLTPNPSRLRQVQDLLSIAIIKVQTSNVLEQRIADLTQLGFTFYDAAHIASAERSHADIFLTTDDRLLRKARLLLNHLNVKVDNPVQWLAQVI